MVQPESTLVSFSTFLRALALDTPAPFDEPAMGVSVLARQGGSVWWCGSGAPSLPTAELLYAHHNLRC
jgi:hypothetical protein